MRITKNILYFFGLIFLYSVGALSCGKKDDRPRILIFNKTEFVFHESTDAGVEALLQLCDNNGYSADVSDDAEVFTEKSLRTYAAVVFLNTAGDVLNPTQEKEFERYIQAGGGFVGIHTAIDTEHNWAWYSKLVGGQFDSQAPVQKGKLLVQDRQDAATQHLDTIWEVRDEWFNLKNISSNVNVLLMLEESSIQGGNMGAYHPISWRQEYDGGRSFFTAMGHIAESYKEPAFLQHLAGALKYAVGDNQPLDYNKVPSSKAAGLQPGGSGFVKTSVACGLYEPMGFDMLPDGKIIFIERRGAVKLFDPSSEAVQTLAEIPVYHQNEEGILGLAIDPNWQNNHWIYLYYAPEKGDEAIRLSRFVFKNDQLELGSEVMLLQIPTDRSVHNYHAGGCLEFDDQGFLYLSTGDNTDHYDDGYSSLDERPGKSQYDSQKSASNSMDLRGKILKIKPLPDGSYLCPAGNLFTDKNVTVAPGGYRLLQDPFWSEMIGVPSAGRYPAAISASFPVQADQGKPGSGRPEIFVMGCRNPFRIYYDNRRQLLVWGEPGPDAGVPDDNYGPEGFDEINIARSAGFYGWPYCVANNKPYRDFDYATEKPGAWFDPKRPYNDSPHNTGARHLPPSRPALIWYPFNSTSEFPLVANGTRCAMAGPAYYCDQYPEETRFPDQYDGKLIIYDWMRHWMLAMNIDSLDQFTGLEPIGGSVRLSRPIDMLIDKNGSLWVLEYGAEWYASNPDACISRIDYRRGSGKNINQTPNVWWDFAGQNRSFYQPGEQLRYKVGVSDPEDGSLAEGRISSESVVLSIDYLESVANPAKVVSTYQPAKRTQPYEQGKNLIDGSDCQSCHASDRQVNGPAYLAIASRYEKSENALSALTKKVIQGGSGNWGDRAMSAHPQLAEKDVNAMIRWILSLSDPSNRPPALQGAYTLSLPPAKNSALSQAGCFIFHARYTDRGAGDLAPVTGSQTLLLRPRQQQAEQADLLSEDSRLSSRPLNNAKATLVQIKNRGFLVFKQIDLKGIKAISFALDVAQSQYSGSGRIELRLGGPDGRLAGKAIIPAANASPGLVEAILEVDRATWPTDGSFSDLYFVVVGDREGERPVVGVDWLRFDL